MKTFQEFTTEAYGRGSRPVRGRDYDDYKDWKPSLYKSGSHRTQDKTPPTHPAAHLKPKKKSAAERMDAAGKRLGLPEEVEIEEGVRPTPVDKPLDRAAFKKRRKSLKGYEQRGDARKRGHEGKEWYNSGRTYSPDEAKRSRAKMDDEERRTRHRSAVDPDDDNDNNYSADKTKNPKKLRKQKAMGELGEGIGMTTANALGNPPALSNRMKLKQALIINKIKSDAKKNADKKYSGKAAATEEYVQELFVTRKSPEQRADEKRKKKVAELIRLMKHAKDTHSDVARKPATKEEYVDESSLSRVVSKTNKGGVAIMSSDRGDKTKKQKQERSKKLVDRIRGAGLPGPTKVKGAYHEKDHGEQTEKSFVVGSGKMGKRKFKKTVTKLGQEGGLKHKRNQPQDSKKDDQDSVLIKQKPGSKSKASWLGTSRRSDADPKLGKKYDQGKLSTRDANKPLKPGEGATIVGKKKMQFK